MANVISVGYARTQTKKEIPLFESTNRVNKIDKEVKRKELNELQELFKK